MKISGKYLRRVINEEIQRVMETGRFTVTGPDPSKALSTEDVMKLIAMGFDVSGIDGSSPEAMALKSDKTGPLSTEELFALFEAGVEPQDLENVDHRNLDPEHVKILIDAGLYS
tara:strand:- start:201 stop:542 length:342 start_codon:yes stop_codon:yes gene_type:complete